MKKLIWIFAAVTLFSCGEEKKDDKKEEGQKIENSTKEDERIVPSNITMGDYAYIELGVKNTPEASFEFYKTLGFTEIPNQFEDENLTMMSDSNLVIVLNKGSIAPAMQIYINKDIAKLEADLKNEGILVQKIENGLQVQSPDGIKVAVLQGETDKLFKPELGVMMAMMQSNDIMDPTKMPNKKIGVFGEFSHQVSDIHKSLKWWAKLGLLGSGIMEYGYKYSIIMDRLSVVGLHEHQNENWFGSAITYFATDQDVRLKKLKEELDPKMVNESEKLGEGSAIVTAPEGNLIFVYKL